MSHAGMIVAIDGDEKNIEHQVEKQMEPFDENGRWLKDGSRWDWWTIGGRFAGSLGKKDIVRKGDVNTADLLAEYAKGSREAWADAHKKDHLDPEVAMLVFGIGKDETEEQYVQRNQHISFYAFLRNRQWHENERLGWFGGTAKTECEVSNEGKEIVGKCLHEIKRKHVIARVIVWNEPAEKWHQKYWKRFIEPLPDSTLLVVVDYHV